MSGESVCTRYPIRRAAIANIRPSCPDPSTPMIAPGRMGCVSSRGIGAGFKEDLFIFAHLLVTDRAVDLVRRRVGQVGVKETEFLPRVQHLPAEGRDAGRRVAAAAML